MQVRRAFEHANRDAEVWLRAIMAPMETQVREHKIQLKRRLDSVSRIHTATETLDERIAELDTAMGTVSDQIEQLARINARIADALTDNLDGTRLAKTA